jgi:hypothetical protein
MQQKLENPGFYKFLLSKFTVGLCGLPGQAIAQNILKLGSLSLTG